MDKLEKIYFVDDDFMEHKFAAYCFRQGAPGAKVEYFFNIKDFKKAFEETSISPDLVVTDHIMRNERGSDLIKWLLSNNYNNVVGRTGTVPIMEKDLDDLRVKIFDKNLNDEFIAFLKQKQ